MTNYSLPIFLIVLLLVTGCSKKNEQNSNEQKDQNQAQQAQGNQMPRWNENFEEIILDDLEIGQQILVMGTENSDGSINANQITIGDGEDSFGNIAGLMRPAMNNGDDNQNNDNQPLGSFDNSSGDRPNFEQMQNMSEEERMKFMEEMRAQREISGENFPRVNMRGNGMTRLNGEIIDRDDTTITLKIKEGGSKLVFYSKKTKVLRFKENSTDQKEEIIE